MKTKPFDLVLAKEGHPVCTRGGRPARIIAFDKKGRAIDGHLVALVTYPKSETEDVVVYDEKGTVLTGYCDTRDMDLVMQCSHVGWVNVYKDRGEYKVSEYIFPTKQDAINDWPRDKNDDIFTTKIEWEDIDHATKKL